MLADRWRKLWRRHGPTFRWNAFRLHGEPPNGAYIPLRVTQIVGGRSWSLALTRQGPAVHPDREDGTDAR